MSSHVYSYELLFTVSHGYEVRCGILAFLFIDQDLSIVWEYKYPQDDSKQQSGAGRWGSEYSSDDRNRPNRTSFHTLDLSGVQDERDVQVPEEEELPVFSMENRQNRRLRE